MYYFRKDPGGNVYTVFYDSTSGSSTLQSIFALRASANNRVMIDEIRGGRADGTDDFGIYIYRGSTSALSTTYVTPSPMDPGPHASAATSLVNVGSTVLPSTTSAKLLIADAGGNNGYLFQSWGDLELIPGQRFDVVGVFLQTVSSAADVHFTLRFREIAKNPRD